MDVPTTNSILEDVGTTKVPMIDELHIYTDGSCKNNGTPSAVAGIGVWVEEHPDKCISKPVDNSYPQTNQVAELLAIGSAVNIGSTSNKLCIYSDSAYSVNCINLWYDKWRINNWKKADGGTPSNIEIIKDIRFHIDYLRNKGHHIALIKVKGHSSNYGNSQAHNLATEAVDTAVNKDMENCLELLHEDNVVGSLAEGIQNIGIDVQPLSIRSPASNVLQNTNKDRLDKCIDELISIRDSI